MISLHEVDDIFGYHSLYGKGQNNCWIVTVCTRQGIQLVDNRGQGQRGSRALGAV